jgi:hypothetical protein
VNIKINWVKPVKINLKFLLSRWKNLMMAFVSVAGYAEYFIDGGPYVRLYDVVRNPV